jgi:hypothetical protein
MLLPMHNSPFKQRIYFSFLLGLFIFGSCTKEQNKVEPLENLVEIAIQQPKENVELAIGDTLFVSAEVFSKIGIHGYELNLLQGDSVLFHTQNHIHGNEGSIKYWIPSKKEWKKGVMDLEIKVLVDHESKQVLKKRKVIFN